MSRKGQQRGNKKGVLCGKMIHLQFILFYFIIIYFKEITRDIRDKIGNVEGKETLGIAQRSLYSSIFTSLVIVIRDFVWTKMELINIRILV